MTNQTTEVKGLPEALQLAELLEFVATNADMGRKPQASDHRRRVSAELRRQHARIAELEAEIAAIGAAEPAIPALQPVAWLVTGNYIRQAFPMHSSAEAYLRGLLSSDPDGGYKIDPLVIPSQTATGASGLEKPAANPGDTESGSEGEWYCETHPDQVMGHAGCGGAGIPACARIGMLTNQLRLTQQEVREATRMRDEMAAAARLANALTQRAAIASGRL